MISFQPYASSSAGNLYRVSSEISSLLVECGLPIRKIRQALNFKLSEIDACLLTHEHMDHAKAAKKIMQAGIDLYCSKGTAEALKLEGHRLRIIEPLKQFKIGPWTILPFDTQHDCAEPVGYLIQNGPDKLLFATDTYYIKYRFRGLTYLAVECNYSQETMDPDINPAQEHRLKKSHLSLDSVKKIIKANDTTNLREIFLLHLSDGNSSEEYFKNEIQGLAGVQVTVCQKCEL